MNKGTYITLNSQFSINLVFIHVSLLLQKTHESLTLHQQVTNSCH